MKKVYKIRKIQDGGSFGTTFAEIDDVNQIDLSLIVKTVKERLAAFNDIPLEITRGRVKKEDARQGAGYIEFQVDTLENRSRRRYWSDITVGFRASYKVIEQTFENNEKFGIAKFAQEVQNKLKQYEGKTIYKNKTIPDAKPKDSKVKDRRIKMSFGEFNISDQAFTKEFYNRMTKYKLLAYDSELVLYGDETSFRELLKSYDYDDDEIEVAIRTGKAPE